MDASKPKKPGPLPARAKQNVRYKKLTSKRAGLSQNASK
jgi:hypothetical protein